MYVHFTTSRPDETATQASKKPPSGDWRRLAGQVLVRLLSVRTFPIVTLRLRGHRCPHGFRQIPARARVRIASSEAIPYASCREINLVRATNKAAVAISGKSNAVTRTAERRNRRDVNSIDLSPGIRQRRAGSEGCD